MDFIEHYWRWLLWLGFRQQSPVLATAIANKMSPFVLDVLFNAESIFSFAYFLLLLYCDPDAGGAVTITCNNEKDQSGRPTKDITSLVLTL